ncbi:hypothetical protein BU15DRAFT_59937 [Melanogaster broomeanus]|nr:hypothetical protein BU15DRAFT_59937 [Melanogaster broomeanus]
MNTRLTGSATFARYGANGFPTAATYMGARKLFWGSDRRLYLPQGRKIPHYSHCKGMQQSIDYWYETNMTTTTVTTPVAVTTSVMSSFVRDLPPHMTAGILSITGPEIEVELEIESSAYMGTSSDYTWQRGLDVNDPAFQPYIAAAWANFQNDMASDRSGNRGKCVRFRRGRNTCVTPTKTWTQSIWGDSDDPPTRGDSLSRGAGSCWSSGTSPSDATSIGCYQWAY